MFYVLYGKDTFRTKRKLKELRGFFHSKTGDLGIFQASGENFDRPQFEEFLTAKNLFSGKNVVICENIFENKSFADFALKNLDKFAGSKNTFLFLEEEINEDILPLIKEKAEKAQKFDPLSGAKLEKWLEEETERKKIKISQADKSAVLEKCGSDLWCVDSETEKFSLGGKMQPPKQISDYNPFAICDAVAGKDRKRAWMLLQQAMLNGAPAEEIFWKIWWQIKNLLVVKKLSEEKAVNAEKESGLKLYPFKKALFAVKNFSQSELENLSWNLVDLFHQSKIGRMDMEIGLEKLIVNL